MLFLAKVLLLAQPCDLTIRSNGTRARDIVSLIPIVVQEDKFDPNSGNRRILNTDLHSYWDKFWSTRAILDGYVEDPAKIAVLEFKNAEWLKMDVLDLCVLNSEGACQINLN